MANTKKNNFYNNVNDKDYFWQHRCAKMDKKKYSYKDIKSKPRFNFGEDNE